MKDCGIQRWESTDHGGRVVGRRDVVRWGVFAVWEGIVVVESVVVRLFVWGHGDKREPAVEVEKKRDRPR